MIHFPKKKKSKKKFDELIDQAAEEWNEAYLRAIDKIAAEGEPHVFSPKFNRLMHERIPAVDPTTGEIHEESAEGGQNE